MRVALILIFIGTSFGAFTQDFSGDFQLLSKSVKRQSEAKEKFFKGMLKIYKNHISDQILNDCIYEQSCSTFTQGALADYGPIRGVLFGTDRMMRCNRLSQSHVAPVRYTKNGKINDHWSVYGKKKK